MKKILIYGANGYTGRLVLEEAFSKKLSITIAGRNGDEILELSEQYNVAYEVFSLEESEKMLRILKEHDVVIHCAGPFMYTAMPMVKACLEAQTHYLDITGEYQIFEQIHDLDEEAKSANIMLMPGAGFDVVPSDCLAAKLKEQMPDAEELKLAFTSVGGGLSRGTSKTMVEGSHEGQKYRKGGKLETKSLGTSFREIDFGAMKQLSVGISWGDIATAYFSTGIPNIEVFTGSSAKQIIQLKWMGRLSFLLKMRWVKNILKKQVDKKRPGPSAEKRGAGKMYLWGQASNGEATAENRLTTPNGYTLTAKTAVLIASKIINDDYKAGYQTPAMAYGSGLILEVEGTAFG
ncbi:saccharopine dehydrogenase family protein [Fulvivirga lutimaris]|uniref:saccharopine dehydrogenase family protein n=1 Tax=Fulvivirga lutimaris TaxID=1819566 RepID=UPI0012BB678D|nr:saccharopine dehydrogenase NADP-binding domain-containing protein [Fulvivirga lutimaris]MTI39773.1 hypothetical protein [Fulvivirga lutimaris]